MTSAIIITTGPEMERIQVNLCLTSSAMAGRRLNEQIENQKERGKHVIPMYMEASLLSKHACVADCG